MMNYRRYAASRDLRKMIKDSIYTKNILVIDVLTFAQSGLAQNL